MRLSSRLLPTQNPSNPGMILIAVPGVRSACSQKLVSDALEHVVVAVDMAALESRRVREGNRKVLGHRALFLRRRDEGVEIVADHLRHARGRNRDHLRLVQGMGVGQAVDHVVEAAEHGGVLGHRRRDRRRRLLEVPRQVRAVVRDASLRAVHEGECPLETAGAKHGAERLAGLGRIDDERFAREVLFAVLLALAPLADLANGVRRMRTLEVVRASREACPRIPARGRV